MSFGSRLKTKRESLGITQPELAKMLGVSKGAIGNWETDVNSPRATLLYDLFDILHCDANYLFQDEMRALYKDTATPEEFENIIKKYRDLDPFGKDAVEAVLGVEHKRCIKLAEPHDNVRYINFYNRLASAGTGQILFDDIPTELITIPDIPKYSTVKYALEVNGSSMEPRFYDGDIILIEPSHEVAKGDIGIFIVDNESYIKELGDQALISLNEEYQDIPLDECSRCIGRVIDKL